MKQLDPELHDARRWAAAWKAAAKHYHWHYWWTRKMLEDERDNALAECQRLAAELLVTDARLKALQDKSSREYFQQVTGESWQVDNE